MAEILFTMNSEMKGVEEECIGLSQKWCLEHWLLFYQSVWLPGLQASVVATKY